MVSDQLSSLRQVNTRLRDSHRTYAKRLAQLKDDPFMDRERKQQRLAQLALEQQATLASIREEASQHAAKIRERASKRPPSTDTAKAQILRALDAGTSWQDIARLCIAQKDRAGIAALAEQLPWEAAAGKLMGGKDRAEWALKNAQTTLAQMETPLLDARELREREEARELDACYGSIEENLKTLTNHYAGGQSTVLMAHQQPVRELYNWLGLPDKDGKSNVGTTSLLMAVEEAKPGTDLLSQSLRTKGVIA